MGNSWYCNNCHNEGFQVTMSNCDCPRCGSSDIDRISPDPDEERIAGYTDSTIERLKEKFRGDRLDAVLCAIEIKYLLALWKTGDYDLELEYKHWCNVVDKI